MVHRILRIQWGGPGGRPTVPPMRDPYNYWGTVLAPQADPAGPAAGGQVADPVHPTQADPAVGPANFTYTIGGDNSAGLKAILKILEKPIDFNNKVLSFNFIKTDFTPSQLDFMEEHIKHTDEDYYKRMIQQKAVSDQPYIQPFKTVID